MDWSPSLLSGEQMISSQNTVRRQSQIATWILIDACFCTGITVPVKYEHVVFCGLSDFQLSLYRLFITSPEIKALLRGKESQPLKAINVLKKLCNHPELLDLPGDLKGCDHLIPEGFVGAKERAAGASSGSSRGRGAASVGVRCDWSGKFLVLER
jgi:DNA repair and recombination RAD54-like protein